MSDFKFKGALPKPADFLARADDITVTVTPASKPGVVPVAFVNVMVGGKEVQCEMLAFPGLVRVPLMDGPDEGIKWNKVTVFGTGPDEIEHRGAERFAKEFLEWSQFTELLEAKIKDAVVANPVAIFKKAVDPAHITVMPSVELIGERGPATAFKLELLDKSVRENIPFDNLDVTLNEIGFDEDGKPKSTSLRVNEIGYNDVMVTAVKGLYLMCNTIVNPLDKKTTGIVRLYWKLGMMTRVARGNKRRRDEADTKAMFQSEATQADLADYLTAES